MRKLIILINLLFGSLFIQAQSIDCSSTLTYRKAEPPYANSELSKSIQCSTGKKYEYTISLNPGKEYCILFFASSILDNRMQFQIIDTNNGKKLMDLPGETKENKKGESVLKEYYDISLEKLVHPYFDFAPEEILNLKIIIDLPEFKYKIKVADIDPDAEAKYEEITEKRKGCVTIFIQDKISDEIGCK